MCDYKNIYYYNEKGNETSFYEINEYPNRTKNKFRISIPLDNSIYQYVTYFDHYYEAYNYLKKHHTKNQVYR